MNITEITVSAGRTFNHPHEDYSNLKPQVTLKAVPGPGEDAIECVRTLQRRAEELVEDHKRHLLASLEELHRLGLAREKMIGLARQLKANQDELDAIRKEWPDLKQIEMT
jgi:hypothetical protein